MTEMKPIDCVTTREVITSVVGDRVIISVKVLGDRLGEALGETVGKALGDRLEEALGDKLGEVVGKLGNVGRVTDEPPAKDTAASAKPRPTITDDSPKDIDTLARIVP